MEPNNDCIRILIVDDQVIARSGLRTLLSDWPHFQIVGEAADGVQAVEMAATLQPDLILMDLRMPEMNGIEATRRIHRAHPHIGILVLSIYREDTSVFPAIRAGARGYILKDADQNELIQAIQVVVRGGVIFSPGIAQHVLSFLSEPPPELPAGMFDELTASERRVLDALAQGLTNTEIASQLGLSPKTVSNYISNVLIKLQAADRAKLMLIALEAGMGRKDQEV